MSCPSISYPHHATGATVGECSMSGVSAHSLQLRPELRSANIGMATCYSPYELSPPQRTVQVPVQKEFSVPAPAKDYSRPLHVDCSVEYELPNAAKPPPGVRNEPLLMIHPCYFRKIESQKRSPFVNNLPMRPTLAAAPLAAKRRSVRGQQIPQQVPQQAAPYPVQYAATATADTRQLWEPMAPLVNIATAAQPYCKVSTCGGTYVTQTDRDASQWTPDPSPDTRSEDKLILPGKFRNYFRAHQHRLHPYVSSGIPLASTFPQMQPVCYNV